MNGRSSLFPRGPGYWSVKASKTESAIGIRCASSFDLTMFRTSASPVAGWRRSDGGQLEAAGLKRRTGKSDPARVLGHNRLEASIDLGGGGIEKEDLGIVRQLNHAPRARFCTSKSKAPIASSISAAPKAFGSLLRRAVCSWSALHRYAATISVLIFLFSGGAVRSVRRTWSGSQEERQRKSRRGKGDLFGVGLAKAAIVEMVIDNIHSPALCCVL